MPEREETGVMQIFSSPGYVESRDLKSQPMTTRRITLDIPAKVLLAEKTDDAAFGLELRTLAAVKLYELGRLSSGRAAELAGTPRVEFLLVLGRYKVFPFQAELDDLSQTNV